MDLQQAALEIAQNLILNGLRGVADRISNAAKERTMQEINKIKDLRKGQKLIFTMSNVNDEATVNFEGLSHTSRLNDSEFKVVYTVGVNGANAIYFEIINGTGWPGAKEWLGTLTVTDAETGEPIIHFTRKGDDGPMATWVKRSWIWNFNVV